MKDQAKTILLVEEDELIASNIINSLRNDGYNVIHAYRGEDALKIYGSSAGAIDLLLLDADPGKGMNSSETASEILKKLEIPAVFLCSNMETENIESTGNVPSYGYILKNSGYKVLSASVRTAFILFAEQRKLKHNKIELKAIVNNLEAKVSALNADVEYLKEKNSASLDENKSPESGQIYKQIMENAGEAIFIAQDYVLKYVNPKTVELTGYTKEELYSRPFMEFIHHDDRKKVMENHQKRIQGDFIPHTYQFRIIHKNSTTKWVELNAILFSWEEKPATLNFVMDITERKSMEESLKSSREILSLAVELSKIGPWEYDFKTNNFIFGDEFYNIYGTSAAREGLYMSGEKYASELVHPDDAYMVKEELDKGFAINEREYSVHLEHRIIRRDGVVRTIAVLARILKNSAGELIRWYGANQDITDRKQTEDKLKQLVNEKEILLIELQHRVKNNMNIISSLLSLGMEKITDEKAKSVFSDAISRIHSMSTIYEQLYSIKNLDKIDLNIYIRDLTNSIFKTYIIDRDKGHLTANLDDIDIDLKRMVPIGLIFNELITNSLKYAYPGDAGGEIRVSMKKSGDEITLKVSDDGVGIPDNIDINNLSSMGLMLVSILAKQLHGEMNIEGKKGTAISIKFRL